MNKLAIHILRFILRHKLWLNIIYLSITFVMTLFVINLKVTHDFDEWFESDEQSYLNYKRFKQDFGNDECVVVIGMSDYLFSKSGLHDLNTLTENLEALCGIRQVISLTNTHTVRLTPFQAISVPLIPTRVVDYERLKKRICSQRIYLDNLVSEDGRAFGLRIYLSDTADYPTVYERIKEVVNDVNGKETTYYLIGNIPVKIEMMKLSGRETSRFLIISIIIMSFLTFLAFRSFSLAFLPVLVAISSVIWTYGLFSALSQKINMLTGIIPLVLIVISVASSVHLIVEYMKARRIKGFEQAMTTAYQRVLKPALMASFTTLIAFTAFLFSDILPVRIFSSFIVIGILFSFTMTFLMIPVWVASLSRSCKVTWYLNPDKIRILAKRMGNFVSHHYQTLIFVSLFIMSGSLIGIKQLHYETDQIGYFKPSNPIRTAFDTAQVWFNGVYTLELIIGGDNGADLEPADWYQLLDSLEKAILSIEQVKVCHSPASVLNSILDYNPGSHNRSNLLRQLSVMDKSETFSDTLLLFHYLSDDRQKVRMTIYTRLMSMQKTGLLLAQMDTVAQSHLNGRKIPYYFTGIVVIYEDLNRRLADSQTSSAFIALLLIVLVFFFLFKKSKLVGLVIIPNVLPVINTLGLMGFMNVPVDVATVLIASISLGIAIDDTVFFTEAFVVAYKENNLEESIKKAYIKVLNAIILTTILLVSGFMIMISSDYLPLIHLGLFVSLNMLLALVYDVFLLPALLMKVYKPK